MKRITGYVVVLFLAVAIMLTIQTPAAASGYANGYTTPAGYTWNNGYWWRNGYAYTRALSYRTVCSYGCSHRCGHNCYQQSYYQYTLVPGVSGKQYSISYNDIDEGRWRDKLLDIAKYRDQYKSKILQSANEHNEFVDSVRVLGMEGDFKIGNNGYEINLAQGGVYGGGMVAGYQQYSQLPAQQGATVYGYNQISDVYANLDIGALYDQILRLRSQSYEKESVANSEVHGLVGDLGSNIAKIKEIEAKGAAAAAALKAAEAKDRATILQEFWKLSPTQQQQVVQTQTQTPNLDTYDLLVGLVNAKCVSCHNPNKQNGGLDMTNLAALTPEQGDAILNRIKHPDPELRMPLGPDNKPGTPLAANEVALFFLVAYGQPTK